MTDTLLRKIEANERILLSIGSRLRLLQAFLKELERVTRRKEFRIRGPAQWLLLLDSRDILVLHFYSWAKAMAGHRGLLNYARSNTTMFHRRHSGRQRGRDSHFVAMQNHAYEEAFVRLFPNGKKRQPTVADFDALKARFVGYFYPVFEDRNANRAHPFEQADFKGKVDMVELEALSGLFDYSIQTINDLRLLSYDSTTGYDTIDRFGREVATDLVDGVLIGASTRRKTLIGQVPREKFYDSLHENHSDAIGGPTAKLFND